MADAKTRLPALDGGPEREKPAAASLARDAFPAFRPRFPWLTGDLQTVRNMLVARPADLSAWPGQRLILDLRDGSGDRLAAMINRPPEAGGRPLVVLVHGLTGCEDSLHIRSAAAKLLGHGYPVLRLNLRGAGPSGPFCRERYHAGRSEDLRDALRALKSESPSLLDRGLVLMGSSLGANMMIKFLAEYGAEFPLHAAVSLSAPIELKAAQRRIMEPSNTLYHRFLLRRMKQECLADSTALSAREREALLRARHVYDFDNAFVAPRGGFDGADDYYARCSARRFLPAVTVPLLAIAARNDPWIPFSSYEAFDWSQSPSVVTLFPDSGGHVGFHGRDDETAWHETCALRFIDAVLA